MRSQSCYHRDNRYFRVNKIDVKLLHHLRIDADQRAMGLPKISLCVAAGAAIAAWTLITAISAGLTTRSQSGLWSPVRLGRFGIAYVRPPQVSQATNFTVRRLQRLHTRHCHGRLAGLVVSCERVLDWADVGIGAWLCQWSLPCFACLVAANCDRVAQYVVMPLADPQRISTP